MPTINIAADTAQATSSMNAFAASLQTTNDRIAKVTQTTSEFNVAGEQTSSTIKGLTKDGQAFSATFKRIADTIDPVTRAITSYRTELSKITYGKMNKELEETSRQTGNFDAFLNRAARSLQYFLLYKGFNFITDQIKEGVSAAKDFQIQISLIRTISQDTQQSFGQWSQDIRKVSDESGISIDKIGKGFYDTVSNQIAKGSQTKAFVKTATDLARVTGSELPDAVNLLSSAINAYGLSAADAESISAVFFKTIDEGRVVASEMANTFGRIAVIGSNLGVTLGELNSVIAITTQKGFKTSDAMTLLTNLMIKLEKPTAATREFFKGLGVDSGEAAIKLLGFNGVIRKMVEAVKSGQVDVSAFFDEIRGRKQFAVFEQSLDQIESFAKTLDNTKDVVRNFNNAIDIRGESNADKLVKEMNKLKNIFAVDAGQWFLNAAQGISEWSGGVDGAAAAMAKFTNGLKYGAGVLAAWAAGSVIARGANYLLTGSFIAAEGATISFTAALGRLALLLAPVAAGIIAFELATRMVGSNKNKSVYDPEALAGTLTYIERIKAEAAELRSAWKQPTGIDSLQKSANKASEEYKSLIGILAQAQLANDRLLDSAKEKSKSTAEALKVGFAGFTDKLKENITEIKKQITEANKEIEKSAKFMLSIGDTIDDIIYKSQQKFGDEQQKLDLTEVRIGNLQQKIKELYASGDKDKIQEARQLTKEVLTLIQTVEEGKEELKKKDLERYLEQNPLERSPYGPDVFTAQTVTMQQRLLAVKAEIAILEKGNVANQEKQIANSKTMVATEEDRLRKLQQAFKAYEALDVFTKEGKIKPEYKTGEKFDPAKLQAEIGRIDQQLVDAGGTFTERVQMMQLLQSKRLALIAEAGAAERSENLKTVQDQILANATAYDNQIKDIRKRRDEAFKAQKDIVEDLGKKSNELAGMGGEIGRALGALRGEDEGGKRAKYTKDIAANIEEYNKLIQDINNPANMINKNGTLVGDPELIKKATDQYDKIIAIMLKAKNELAPEADLSIAGPGGAKVEPGTAAAAIRLEGEEYKKQFFRFMSTFNDEMEANLGQRLKATGPLAELKKQFPEMAEAAEIATLKVDQQFKNLASGEGFKQLKAQLEEIQKLMPKIPAIPGGKEQGINVVGEGGDVYAASGGLVGAFPGQPRGVDQYPIWAAKGEYIVNAQSAALFKPMLEAINAGRYPRYMAGGGSIGDTNIGDVTVNVTGGATGSQTGRTIARELERELRRRTINLTRR